MVKKSNPCVYKTRPPFWSLHHNMNGYSTPDPDKCWLCLNSLSVDLNPYRSEHTEVLQWKRTHGVQLAPRSWPWTKIEFIQVYLDSIVTKALQLSSWAHKYILYNNLWQMSISVETSREQRLSTLLPLWFNSKNTGTCYV